MPKKQTLQTGLNVRAGSASLNLAGIPKTYTEMYNQAKTITNSNAPVEVFKFADTLAGDSFLNAKQLVLVNEGYGGIEVQIKYDAWANGTPDTNGSAVYTNFLLGEGEYLTFNNSKVVNFDENTSAANAYTRDSDRIPVKGYTESGVILDGAHNHSTTTLTVPSTHAYFFKPGDYVLINVENEVGSWHVYSGGEIVEIISVDSSTQCTMRRARCGTMQRNHDDNAKIYWIDFNYTPNNGGHDYQATQDPVAGGIPKDDALMHTVDTSIAKIEGGTGEHDYISDTDGSFLNTQNGTDWTNNAFQGIGNKRIANVKVSGGTTETTFITHQEVVAGTAKAYVHMDNDIDAVSAGTSTLVNTVSTITNKWGQYRQNQFPGGYGRSNTLVGTGLVPGSVAIKFAVGGRASFGYTTGERNQDSGLESGRSYRFDVQSDGRKETIRFTMGGDTSVNGVFSKIMGYLEEINWDVVGDCYFSPVAGPGGVIEFKSLSNMHTLNGVIATPDNQVPESGASTVRLSAGTAGSGYQLFGSGIFPTNPPPYQASYFPEDTIYDPDQGLSVIDERNFMLDDGLGNLYVTQNTNIALANSQIFPGAGWMHGPMGGISNGTNAGGERYMRFSTSSSREGRDGSHGHDGGHHDHSASHKHSLYYPSDAPNSPQTHSHTIPNAAFDPSSSQVDLDQYNTVGQHHTSREYFVSGTPGYDANQTFETISQGPGSGNWGADTRLWTTEYGQAGYGVGHGHEGGQHAGHALGLQVDPLAPVYPPRPPVNPNVIDPTNKIYTGKVDYETGAIWIGWGPSMAEMQFSCSYNSAMSGNAQHSATAGNGIQSVYARGTNQKTNGKLRILALR